jgi:hypothetical protein
MSPKSLRYVRSALGDVGNLITGDGLRCIYHSMGATGSECSHRERECNPFSPIMFLRPSF